MQIGGAVVWRSVIIVARALPSVLRFPTPTDVPTGPGSPTLSVSRPLSTVLRAMCTLVPDASVPTRWSALFNSPASINATAFAVAFWFYLFNNHRPVGGASFTGRHTDPPLHILRDCHASVRTGSQWQRRLCIKWWGLPHQWHRSLVRNDRKKKGSQWPFGEKPSKKAPAKCRCLWVYFT